MSRRPAGSMGSGTAFAARVALLRSRRSSEDTEIAASWSERASAAESSLMGAAVGASAADADDAAAGALFAAGGGWLAQAANIAIINPGANDCAPLTRLTRGFDMARENTAT